MLAHSASPNVPDDEGWTAVHQAAASPANSGIALGIMLAGIPYIGFGAAGEHEAQTFLS